MATNFRTSSMGVNGVPHSGHVKHSLKGGIKFRSTDTQIPTSTHRDPQTRSDVVSGGRCLSVPWRTEQVENGSLVGDFAETRFLAAGCNQSLSDDLKILRKGGVINRFIVPFGVGRVFQSWALLSVLGFMQHLISQAITVKDWRGEEHIFILEPIRAVGSFLQPRWRSLGLPLGDVSSRLPSRTTAHDEYSWSPLPPGKG